MSLSNSFLRESRALLVLATPIVISQLAQMGMSFTDTVMSGRHAESSLAGVAIGSSVWIPCFLFLTGVLMAVTPFVAQAWGAQQHKDIRVTVQQGMWLALALGIAMMLVMQSLGIIFDYMEMEPVAYEQARGYSYAVSFGLPAMALFVVLRSLNEGTHFTRPYMYVSIGAVLLNIPLNYIFVYGKLGLPEMGGVGCGWATALVLYLEFFALLFVTRRQKELNTLGWFTNWQKPELSRIMELLRLGIPIGIGLLIESSMFSLIALFLAKLGSTAVAGHQVAMSFVSLMFMVPLSLAMGLTIRCGYFVGRGEPDKARYAAFLGMGLTLCCACIFSSSMLLFPQYIASLYSNDVAVQALAVKLLFFGAIFQFSDAIQVSAAGVLRGYKDTRFTFVTMLLAYWGIGLPLGYMLGVTEIFGSALGAQGFWVGLIAGLGFASVFLAARVHMISKKAVKTAPVFA
ncbi:MAG: MATE family efflux transporter [Gammaproteobacteria bacterium]|nr:MATE family efflux transporter [Gammaproteobacteria bacterium]